jgi:polar amino acid transport system permease protein
MRDVVAPQAFRVALPSAANYLIGLMKETAVASTIGVTELTYQGNQLSQLTFRGLQVFAVVGLFYILLSLPIAWLSRIADAHLRSKVAR